MISLGAFSCVLWLALNLAAVEGYYGSRQHPRWGAQPSRLPLRHAGVRVGATPEGGDDAAVLPSGPLAVSTPSQDEAVARGIREWPGILKKGAAFDEPRAPFGTTRYVYGGRGTLVATPADGGDAQTVALAPNVLVEVQDECSLSWTVDEELTLLTPDFEQKGLFVGVAASLIAVFGFLLANAGGGG